MKNTLTNLRFPALLSFLLVLPFIILELVNRWDFGEDFPIVLFATLWLLLAAFLLILVPILRSLRARRSLLARPFELLLRMAFLALIAIVWVSIVSDQMPCFLGVSNCD